MSRNDSYELFATCGAPLAPMLERELRTLGARDVQAVGAGVRLRGDLSMAYRACLWSRLASRVLLPLSRIPAADGDSLYEGARTIDWPGLFCADTTFAVDCTVRRARITHSHFAALRVKDAIADSFRDAEGRRPDVDTREPDIRVHVHLRGTEARLALDLAGQSLHRRGYRLDAGPAPLRETLAAAVLYLAGWPDEAGFPALLDPLCGSGTLLIEAAMMAGDVAPGLSREHFGFLSWLGHDAGLWASMLDEAHDRREQGLQHLPDIRGADRNPTAIEAAAANLARAGLDARVGIEVRELSSWMDTVPFAPRGLLVTNPPYGGRMGEHEAQRAREQLAALCDGPMHGWTKALLLPDDGGWPRAHASESMAVTNGTLPCRIHILPAREAAIPGPTAVDVTPLLNRLARNRRRLKGWLRREQVTCHRLYDADLPDFNFALDLYASDTGVWAHVQEYAPPPQVEPGLAAARRDAALAALPGALDITTAHVVCKTRRRQRGDHHYQRRETGADTQLHEIEVTEGGVRLLVNLHSYLDTGLFLDHRPVRRWIHEHSRDARFLNLFAYTGAATVHAAAGGARETLSVDLSRTYLDWAGRNLALNGFGEPEHRLERADCVEWLERRAAHPSPDFDIIFLDPPTFSNSKRMTESFDVQRDHAALIRQALLLLAPGGTLIFSCNRRGFRLHEDALPGMSVTDWTRPSIPPDFSRPAPPHRCWMIRHGT